EARAAGADVSSLQLAQLYPDDPVSAKREIEKAIQKHEAPEAYLRLFDFTIQSRDLLSLPRKATDYADHGEFEPALRLFSRLTTLRPEDHWNWYLRGCLLAYLGRTDELRAD